MVSLDFGDMLDHELNFYVKLHLNNKMFSLWRGYIQMGNECWNVLFNVVGIIGTT